MIRRITIRRRKGRRAARLVSHGLQLAARVGSGGAGGAGSRRRRTERQRGRRRRADRGGGSPAFRDNAIPARFNAGFARGGSARRQERDCGLYTADRRQEREGEGKKGRESSLATLRNFWGGELVEEKARGRRRNGDDSREGRHHDEEDDELGTRVVSDFTGDDGCGGWWDSGEKIILGIPKQGASLWVVYIFVWSCHKRLV